MPELISITEKDNELHYIINIVSENLNAAIANDDYPVWGESLFKLKNDLSKNDGIIESSAQLNLIIKVLLQYVPDELKRISE
jgi:hypothetical protein